MAQVTHVIKSVFRTVTTTGGNAETVLDLLGMKSAGIIRQVHVRASSGGGANFEISIFDKVGEATNSEHIIYTASGQSYATDIAVTGYFDTQSSKTDADLHMTLTPASDGTFEVRIDVEILMG